MAQPADTKCPASGATGDKCPVADAATTSNPTATSGSTSTSTPAAASSTADPAAWVDDGTRTPIPQPRERFLLGNISELKDETTVHTFRRLAKIYGPIYQLRLGDLVAFISSRKLVSYISNEDKFEKGISTPLAQVRNFAGDGLFTAYGSEHNWHLAHRILVPAFGPLAIKKMQPMMMDVIAQMLMSWEHHAGQPFEVSHDYTKLTLDTIGLCAFRYRFNSFHTTEMHPFVNIMVDLLQESGNRAHRPGLVQSILVNKEHKFQEEIKELWRQADDIVAERKRRPDPDAHDLLNNMIYDKDPKTGEGLSDENIRFNMVTFLIAGHETTSGLLSFITYFLLKNPRVFLKARAEADKVIAEAGGNLNNINPAKLTYIDAICKESLRLQPTAPAFTVTPKSENGEVLPGGYEIPKGQNITVVLHELHRDPEAWGVPGKGINDVEEFRPERFLEAPIPKNAWKPFGNGARGCIGRGFAMQEAVLVLALIVNRFDLEMADPGYDLTIKSTLTIKPKDFFIIVRPRKSRSQSLLRELIAGGAMTSESSDEAHAPKPDEAVAAAARKDGLPRLYVLYGSNSGSCEGLAHDLARTGAQRGFDVTLGDLDSVTGGSGKLPTDGPVLIATASYEGKPTDNARMFVAALEQDKAETMEGVKYSVMGAGHHDWATTFHKIPKYIDQRIAELGGERILPLALADAGADIVGDFEQYQTDIWAKLGGDTSGASATVPKDAAAGAAASGNKPKLPVRIVPRSANAASLRVAAGIESFGTIEAQEVLVNVNEDHPQMNMITVKLPENQTYEAGDYLAVLPKNPPQATDRVLKHFGIRADDNIVLDLPESFLPAGTPIKMVDLLAEYVELGQPVSKTLLPKLADMCTNQMDAEAIRGLASDYATNVTKAHLSLLDILEKYRSCAAPLAFFLSNIPKMKIRQYSISSTPLADPTKVSLTFTVHMTRSADGSYYPAGVASNYLAFLNPGDKVLCAVKASSEFHLPSDISTPVVMFTAGSGIAPFRGFIMERALQKEAGRKVGPMVLYYGARTEDDMVYRTELCKWSKEGVLDFRPVLSRSKEPLKSFSGTGVTVIPGTKYAQDRVWLDRKDIEDMFDHGAQFYTCGSGARLGKDLRKTIVDIIAQTQRCKERKDDPEKVYERLAATRFRTDVFL